LTSYINPRSKLLYHVDKLDQIRRTGTTTAPVNVEIDLSNRCSHGCSWCHASFTHTRGPLAGSAKPDGMLDMERYRQLLAETQRKMPALPVQY
jgi:DNA repair photolyase